MADGRGKVSHEVFLFHKKKREWGDGRGGESACALVRCVLSHTRSMLHKACAQQTSTTGFPFDDGTGLSCEKYCGIAVAWSCVRLVMAAWSSDQASTDAVAAAGRASS